MSEPRNCVVIPPSILRMISREPAKRLEMPCYDLRCRGTTTWHVVEDVGYYGGMRTCTTCGRVSHNHGDGWSNEALPGGTEANAIRQRAIERANRVLVATNAHPADQPASLPAAAAPSAGAVHASYEAF